MLNLNRLASHLRKFPLSTIPVGTLRPAAVLVPLFKRDGRDCLLLTERTNHLVHHAGEISFPGGGFDHADQNLQETVLRETEEELGIPKKEISLLGRLDDFYSIHGYHVTPYVGTIPTPEALQPDPYEIARIIEAPIDLFRDSKLHHVEEWEHKGQVHLVDFYQLDEFVVWGLTAAILRQFLHETEGS
jgi:8-oxo-dGTP pyrophosphatase MutT (NUDIX family)